MVYWNSMIPEIIQRKMCRNIHANDYDKYHAIYKHLMTIFWYWILFDMRRFVSRFKSQNIFNKSHYGTYHKYISAGMWGRIKSPVRRVLPTESKRSISGMPPLFDRTKVALQAGCLPNPWKAQPPWVFQGAWRGKYPAAIPFRPGSGIFVCNPNRLRYFSSPFPQP